MSFLWGLAGAATRLTDHAALDFNAAFAPDGRRIAFVSGRDGNQEIYILDREGGRPTRLTDEFSLDDRPAWHPEQAVTVEEALLATTVNPAWLAREERRRGKLLPGYLADLVVLDRDPLGIPLDELPEVRVVATMLGGRWVSNPPPWS